MANVSYRPGQQVTDAADALKQWQQNRPSDYQSSYQDKINSLLGQLQMCIRDRCCTVHRSNFNLTGERKKA